MFGNLLTCLGFDLASAGEGDGARPEYPSRLPDSPTHKPYSARALPLRIAAAISYPSASVT